MQKRKSNRSLDICLLLIFAIVIISFYVIGAELKYIISMMIMILIIYAVMVLSFRRVLGTKKKINQKI